VTSTQEAQWVLRAQVGDREALEALLRAAQPALTRYVGAIVGPADAEDVTQDVLVSIYRKLWALTSPELFRPWMYRIASRAAFRFLQKRRRWPEHLRDDAALDDPAAQDLAAIAPLVDDMLRDPRLTPASRAVRALHFREGMTLAEAAAVLRPPIRSAATRSGRRGRRATRG
jgi:RNA polymerase sigma-70 factor, ECF subfamily